MTQPRTNRRPDPRTLYRRTDAMFQTWGNWIREEKERALGWNVSMLDVGDNVRVQQRNDRHSDPTQADAIRICGEDSDVILGYKVWEMLVQPQNQILRYIYVVEPHIEAAAAFFKLDRKVLSDHFKWGMYHADRYRMRLSIRREAEEII